MDVQNNSGEYDNKLFGHSTDKIKNYVALMFDVLGQKDALNIMDVILDPDYTFDQKNYIYSNRKLTYEFIDNIYETCEKVKDDHKELSNQYNKIIDDSGDDCKEFKKLLKRFLLPNLLHTQFSDTYVISYPTSFDDEEYLSVSEDVQISLNMTSFTHNLLILFDLASYVMINSIVNDSPVRGAIDIGPGIITKYTKTLYGKVLSNVSILESKVAQYPRYIISSDIVEKINQYSLICDNIKFNHIIKDNIKLLRKLIIKDQDFNYVLDYIYMYKNKPELSEEISNIYKIVLSKKNKFSEENNDKLFFKYNCLLKFLQWRMNEHLDIKFDTETQQIIN